MSSKICPKGWDGLSQGMGHFVPRGGTIGKKHPFKRETAYKQKKELLNFRLAVPFPVGVDGFEPPTLCL